MSKFDRSAKDIALELASSGLSVLPIKTDGTKGPAVQQWKSLQSKILSPDEISEVFNGSVGLGIICGSISGNLEVLDFDVPESGKYEGHCFFEDWIDLLDDEEFKLVKSLPIVNTPTGGVHVYYRCQSVSGNLKLASAVEGKEKKTLIETRGEGGYVIAPGSPKGTHPCGGLYEVESGDLFSVPVISDKSRDILFSVARSFDEDDSQKKYVIKKTGSSPHVDTSSKSNRPGDDYNRRGSWAELLEPLGWTFAFRRRDNAEMWRRPGKEDRGVSATIREIDGLEIFHSFSSNCDPLPHEQSITKFTAYALINHNGDFESAARELGKTGFGDQGGGWISIEIESKRDESVPWAAAYDHESNSHVHDYFEGDVSEVPESPPLHNNEPPEASIFLEEIDQLEFQISSDQEDEIRKEKERLRTKELEWRAKMLARGPGILVWKDSGDPPAKKMIKKKGKKLIKTKKERPRDTSWFILNDKYSKDLMRTIHYQNGEFMVWNGEKYRRVSKDAVRANVSSYLTHFAEFESKDPETGKKIYKEFEVRDHRVTEMMRTIMDMSSIDEDDCSDPCWLCTPDGVDELPDAREVVCCKNGLLDLENMKLMKSTPAYYSFTSTNIEYDPNAIKPENWIRFLRSSLDEESILLLQEWFGYCLVQDTRLQKMLMVVGKPGSGKGTAMSVLQQLVGKGSYCSMDFERLGNNFALWTALGKSLMIFPDARQSYGQTKGSVIGTLLSISGEDDLFIDRKKEKPVTQKLNTRITIVSNEVINLTDASGALDRRMLWIRFPGFEGKEDSDLKSKINRELSGILNWSIEGWKRLHENGKFTAPESSEYLRASFREQASPIKSFLEDLCDVGSEFNQPTTELFKYWTIWRKIKGYKSAQSESGFGKQLLSADMRIRKDRIQDKGKRKKVYKGVSLNMEKLEEFVRDSLGDKEWDYMASGGDPTSSSDIVDLFEWSKKKKNA